MLIEDAVSSGTPQFVIDSYATLAERAKTQSFGLIEEDVIVLDTETTGLSVQDNELIEISAARLSGREVVDRFDTFVHPKQLIPAEITELTSITNADVADAPSAVEAVAALADFVGGCPVIAHNATFASRFRAWPRTSCLLWPICLAVTRYHTVPMPTSTPCVAYGACCSWRSPTCPRASWRA